MTNPKIIVHQLEWTDEAAGKRSASIVGDYVIDFESDGVWLTLPGTEVALPHPDEQSAMDEATGDYERRILPVVSIGADGWSGVWA